MKKVAVVAIMLTAMICTPSAWCQGRPAAGRPGHMGGPMMSCPAMAVMPMRVEMINHFASTLKLSSAQSAKLKQIAAKSDKTLRSLQLTADKSTKALHSALLAPKYNAKNVNGLAAKAEKAEANIVAASIDAWTQARSVLTANQIKKLQAVMSKQRPGFGQRPAGPPPVAGAFPPPPGRAR